MLESWCQDWQGWGLAQAPRLLQRLPGGRTNCTYLIEVSGRRLVLRRNHPASVALGIDRDAESRVLAAAAQAGIAPRPVYCDDRVLLTEFVSGVHWPDPGAGRSGRTERLLGLMERVHGLRVDLPRYDYLAHADAYWRQLPAPQEVLAREHARMQPLLRRFQNGCSCQALCHHDPVPGNIIAAADRLYLIDWEYAGMGCRAFDFAVIASHLGSTLIPPDLNCDLQLAMRVYRYLCRLWEALR